MINAKACIVLPSLGCSGCISEGEDFVIKNLNANGEKLMVILTNYQSEKMLKVRFGEPVFRNKNLLLDKEKTIYNNGLVGFYSKIYYFENNKVVDVQEASPDNPKNVWADLKKHLARQAR
ncbi:MAG: hypothetical protein MUE85_15035 [Microscillaceae bacterium]|jgi:hypothetical protein|nr:hypothetical protein [Microscillaceae bacterium]